MARLSPLLAGATAIFIFINLVSSGGAPVAALNQEGLYLLSAKSTLDDPENSLADWNPRDLSPCNWTGITCSGSGDVVTAVDLPNMGLVGPFPLILCRLSSLSRIDFSLNYINSSLPSSSFLPCPSLSHLDLSQNLLVGALPPSLSLLPSLLHLDLSANNFSGDIPANYGAFPKLQVLSLTANLLSTTVPSFLGNISTLRQLNLSYNPFAAGPIPAALGNLSALEVLWMSTCNLVGEIPASLGNLAALADLDLSSNSLSGEIPPSFAMLSGAVQIELYNNSLSGEIPAGFSNLTGVLRIDASMNLLHGPIPEDIFLAPKLQNLHLYQNNLSGDLPATISRSRTLGELRLFSNELSGTLPADFGENSPFTFIDLSDNRISGEIPRGVCGAGVLSELLMIDNYFTGTIPEGLGGCTTLQRVRLANNRLSGDVPAGIWGLPHMSLLELAGNFLSGEISPQISGAANLSALLISDNQFTGSIPPGIGSAGNLYQFSAANNRLSGDLPPSLGDLATLGQLDLHNNSLSGELQLDGIRSWTRLSELNLAMNEFTGGIPPELGDLPVLNYIDLSNNQLSGEIPFQLQNLKLNMFNLSNNQLTGKLPPLFNSDVYRASFLGNPGLCGDLAGLCSGDSQVGNGHGRLRWLIRLFFAVAALVIVAGVAWFYWRYRTYRKKSKLAGGEKSKWTLTSFHKLGFSEYEILDCLDEDNVIGSGASGKVYKAVLSNGEAVAVKKLWGSATKATAGDEAFESEVTTLGKIRHKNIVKLWCSCTTKDCKLLVYEYMSNGSLGDLLRSSKAGLLDWPTRYKIAVDAADGLSYLHHGCVPPIVHRDVKSNNILLDAEFVARVADFGVAKAVEAVGKGPKSMSVIAGSCGYIAPEYAYTLRVNEKSDIYSFGVVLLELVTGKPPIDPAEFGERDLAKWVLAAVEQQGPEHVVDPKLDAACHMEEILNVLGIGILCTSSLPINRPSMRAVVKMLIEARTGGGPPLAPEKKQAPLAAAGSRRLTIMRTAPVRGGAS